MSIEKQYRDEYSSISQLISDLNINFNAENIIQLFEGKAQNL